jgi:hypothetical protein
LIIAAPPWLTRTSDIYPKQPALFEKHGIIQSVNRWVRRLSDAYWTRAFIKVSEKSMFSVKQNFFQHVFRTWPGNRLLLARYDDQDINGCLVLVLPAYPFIVSINDAKPFVI